MPLWQLLGGRDANVPVSWTVTRAPPTAMAGEAAAAAEQHGVGAFKVKTGQGLATDRCVLGEIRSAVGHDAALFADSNGAGRADEIVESSKMLADFGVRLFEDPCPLVPNEGFRTLQQNSQLPILVDNGCRSTAEGSLFLDVGARALSVKIMKTGITESRTIAGLAQARQARVAVGISATSSLGAMIALSLSASLPDDAGCAPCEETFFASVDNVLHEPLKISCGKVALPAVSGFAPLIDWKKVAALAIG